MSKLSSIDGCFQKACGVAVIMQKGNQAVLAIILLLGVTSTPYLFDQANSSQLSDDKIESTSDKEQSVQYLSHKQ